MPPRNFCDIDSKYYLFGKSDTPEEKVRQWMIFELLAVYNVPVQAISIESPVKVGTRQYRADILLLKDYRPWAVIECKRQEDSDISNGIEQAVSYASCLQAEFAAFTNGKDWLVKRCRSNQWISVPDLPTYSSGNSSKAQLSQLSASYASVILLMQWIHGCSSTLGEREFLLSSLEYFCGHSRLCLCEYLYEGYCWASLLRDIIAFFKDIELCYEVALSDSSSISERDMYCLKKMSFDLVRCHKKFDPTFELDISLLPIHVPDGCQSLGEFFKFYQCNPEEAVDAFDFFFAYFDDWDRRKTCENLDDLRSILIKLTIQVVKHFNREWRRGSKIPILNSNLGLTLGVIDLIRFIFEKNLNMNLPDISNDDAWECFYWDYSDLREFLNKRIPES